jgi:acylphosphatase
MSENTIRKTYHFKGAVQGVGFRYRAAYAAREAGVTGWVRNEFDGSVRMEIQGTEEQIDRVIQAIERGRYISIRQVRCMKIPLREDERDFVIKDDVWF